MCIEPTVFLSIPEDVTPSFPDPVTLRVKATSDPDTEVSYTWYHYDEQSECEDKWCVVYQVANKTHISHDDGSSLTILNTGVDDLGQYRCVASNGVDTVVHEVKLITPGGTNAGPSITTSVSAMTIPLLGALWPLMAKWLWP